MKFGLKDSEFKILTNLAILPLKNNGAQTVWIFGSRARGDQKPFSDIDILYSLSKDKKLPEGLLFKIRDSLEESRLPFKVIVSDSELAESYREHVNKDKIKL